MKIIIAGVNLFSQNRGVQALGYGARDFIKQIFPQAKIEIFSHTKGYKESKEQLYLHIDKILRLFTYSFLPIIGNRNPIIKKLKEADYLFDLTEGDSFADIYGFKRFRKTLLFKRIARRYSQKYILLPQTIGPFWKRRNLFLARRILKGIDKVYVRDEASYKLMQRLGIKTLLLPDVALFMEAKKPKNYRVPFKDYVALNVSGLLYFGSTKKKLVDTSRYRETVEKIVELLLKKKQSILLVPHTYSIDKKVREDDFRACQEVSKKFKKKAQGKIALLDQELEAPEIKYLLAQARLTIASRMHACLGSLTSGKLAVALAYSYKFKGNFKHFGLEDYVLELHTGKIDQKEVLEKINRALEKYPAENQKLKKKVEDLKKETLERFRQDLFKEPNFIDSILRTGLCAGCGLCASLGGDKIQMTINQEGFLRPKQNGELTTEKKKLIKEVCPGLIIKHSPRKDNYHPLWGPIIKSRVGWSTDPQVRYIGSSGGAISAILLHLLETKKIDSVVHVGASSKNPLLNEIKISKNRKQILENAGSRYSPSSPLETIDKLLKEKGSFALVAKPCDMSALRNYADFNLRVNQKIKYWISFFCAGVPSLKGTEKILEHFNVEKEEVESLRYRGEGWPGKTKIKLKNGKNFEMSYQESWGQILNRYLQFRCKICPDGTGEFADLACADAWHGDQKGYPDFSEKEGRSLIISRNEKGEELVKGCLREGYLKVEDFDLKRLERIQPYQAKRKKGLLARLLAIKLFLNPIPEYSHLGLFRVSLKSGLKGNFDNFLGMARRIQKRK